MIEIVDHWNYIFKNSKIARMSYSHVSCRYELYDRFGSKIGEIDEINLEEAKQFFELDKIPCVDVRDCFETEEESNIHFKKVGEFCQFGKVNEDLDIDYFNKI